MPTIIEVASGLPNDRILLHSTFHLWGKHFNHLIAYLDL